MSNLAMNLCHALWFHFFSLELFKVVFRERGASERESKEKSDEVKGFKNYWHFVYCIYEMDQESFF